MINTRIVLGPVIGQYKGNVSNNGIGANSGHLSITASLNHCHNDVLGGHER